MTEVVDSKHPIAASPASVHKGPTKSKKTTKGKSPRKPEKDGASPKALKKSTTKTKASTKKIDKEKKKTHLDSPLPPPVTEKKLKRKISAGRPATEAAEASQDAVAVPQKRTQTEEPTTPCRRNSPSQVSELLSWEKKEHDKLFSTQSVATAKDIANSSPSESIKSSKSRASPGQQMMTATANLATQMKFMKPSTSFEVDTPRIPIVSPELKGSKQKAAPSERPVIPRSPMKPPASTTTPRQKPKKSIMETVSSQPGSIAPELNLIKRSTPFEVDAPRQVLRQPTRMLTSATDSYTSCDDGCMTEEQRVWKGIDSVLMDADSVSTSTSDNHVLKAGMYNSTRSRGSSRGLKAHLSKKTPMSAGDMVSVASMEDVNSKSMLRAVRKNSIQASLNLPKAIAKVLEDDERRNASDDSSLPSLASLSTCNTSSSSNQKPAAPSKMPSKLDRFMQKSKQVSNRRDDGSMPSLSSFRDDDFSQCSSVLSVGLPSLCSIREDELGSYRSENDDDWRNGVSTIPEVNEDLHESPVKGRYADLWAESPVKESDELYESIHSLQLEDLLEPTTPVPAKTMPPKEAMKKRPSLSGAEPVQSKLRSFMSNFMGGDNNNDSQKQTDIISLGSAGDIHPGAVSPHTVQRLHASDGCLLGTHGNESSNNKSNRLSVSGNLSATDFSHFASENAKYTSPGLYDHQAPSTPSRHRRALLSLVSNSISKMKSRVMTKGTLSPKRN